MAYPNTEIDLDALHQAILDNISATFPDLVTVDDYREDRKPLTPSQLPACLVELVELEPSQEDDPGTEQVACWAGFEAHFIIGFRTPEAKRAIRKRAAQFIVHLRNQRWGMPVGGALPGRGYDDPFTPELDQFEVWTVEWRQLVHLGKSVWNNDGTRPDVDGVMIGYAPDIGPPHEDDYVPLDGVPQV